MNTKDFKLLLLNEGADSIKKILKKYGYHSIVGNDNSEYLKFGFCDGENQASTTLYLDDNLGVKAYTRSGISDIFDLLTYNKMQTIPMVIENCLALLGYKSGGTVDFDFINSLTGRTESHIKEKEVILPEIPRERLDKYLKVGNWLFKKDGINIQVMQEFEIGMDNINGIITIPIYDENNRLVGVKGRHLKISNGLKYSYLEKCKKTQILYGLNKSIEHIRKKNKVIIGESEKFVLQLFSVGMRNVVAISGHDISNIQVSKLERLFGEDVEIIFALDKDVGVFDGAFDKRKTGFYYNLLKKFKKTTNVSIIFDDDNLLEEKESPSDRIDVMKILYKKRRKFKGKKE